MKLAKVISVFLAAVIVLGFPASAAFEQGQQAVQDAQNAFGYHSIDSGAAYLGTEDLVENVGAALLYEMNSDTLMYAKQADEKVFPSSLVKIMTALIAVQKGNLQDVVTVTQTALDAVPYYAASAELQADEQITLSDLLYCMMVGSANDAAAVIAEHISGSQAAFVQEMNQYAAALGCMGTQFVNAHGLHDENQYTTARDLGRILVAAVQNELFMTYFSAVNYTVPATNKAEERELSTGNFLMSVEKLQKYYDDRVIGGRTGIADDESRCLATVAQKNGMQIVCIVMGSISTLSEDGKTDTYGSFAETSKLLDACFDNNHVVQIVYENQVLRQCPVINGENDVILASANSIYSVLPASVSVRNLVFKYDDVALQIEAPVSAGQVLTNVQVWHNGSCVAQTGLVTMNDVRYVEPLSTDDSATDNNFAIGTPFIVILSVVCGVVGLLLLIRGVRYIRILLDKHKKKTIRENRRRSR